MTTSGFQIEVLTPQSRVYASQAASAILPGALGSFGVLKGHMPLVSLLRTGQVEIVNAEDSSRVFVSISGGFAEVSRERVLILADEAEVK